MDKVSNGVDLADAIGALRDALVRAMWDSRSSRVRFRVEPVDLTDGPCGRYENRYRLRRD